MTDTTLRELQDTDWPALLACLKDSEAVRWTEFEPFTADSAKALVWWAVAAVQAKPRTVFAYAVTSGPDGGLVGIATLTVRDVLNGEADVGVIIARGKWGRGHGTAAVKSLLALGFGPLSLRRIVGECDPANIGSARVLEKAGMIREGLHRAYRLQKGRWVDRVLYSASEMGN